MKNLILIIALIGFCSCLPQKNAEKLSKAIAEKTKEYCEPKAMESCVYNLLAKKAAEKTAHGEGDKALAGSLVCSVMAGVVIDALNEKTFIKNCKCDSAKIKAKVKPAVAVACAGLGF